MRAISNRILCTFKASALHWVFSFFALNLVHQRDFAFEIQKFTIHAPRDSVRFTFKTPLHCARYYFWQFIANKNQSAEKYTFWPILFHFLLLAINEFSRTVTVQSVCVRHFYECEYSAAYTEKKWVHLELFFSALVRITLKVTGFRNAVTEESDT